MKMFGEKMKAKWYISRAQMKYWWLSQKKWQKNYILNSASDILMTRTSLVTR